VSAELAAYWSTKSLTNKSSAAAFSSLVAQYPDEVYRAFVKLCRRESWTWRRPTELCGARLYLRVSVNRPWAKLLTSGVDVWVARTSGLLDTGPGIKLVRNHIPFKRFFKNRKFRTVSDRFFPPLAECEQCPKFLTCVLEDDRVGVP
jgi:hypothetical protein